jgi:NitT/TauT family transport system substrate-binding protein
VRGFKLVSSAMLFVLGLGLHSNTTAQQRPPDHIHILTLVGKPLPVIVGQQHGTFAKYGVDVETENLPNSQQMREALAEGKGDAAYAAVDNAVAMVELGHADVEIVSGGEGSLNELIAQPENKSLKDLQGKVLLVDAVNTAYALQLKAILLAQGMRPERDYKMNAFGATPSRLTALLNDRTFAGSMLGPPFSITAKERGLVSLGSVRDLIGDYQSGGHFVERKWAAEHRATLTRYLAAFIESQRWLMDPAHEKEVIQLIADANHVDTAVAAKTYSVSMGPGGFQKDAHLDPEGFENVLKMRAAVEGQWDGHPPAGTKYYDDSYYQAALGMIQ